MMDPPGQVQEAHWNEEAKALLAGLILFCVAHEEEDRRSLASVREYLTLPPDRFRELLTLMQESHAARGFIARAANRFLGKSEREATSVLSSAQRHTYFLDSPRIAVCMARSDFAFADLRDRIASVFLVLPPHRLDAYSRWLRLLVSQALQDIARDAEASTLAGIPDAAQGLMGSHNGSEGFLEARSASQGTLKTTAGSQDLTGFQRGPEAAVTQAMMPLWPSEASDSPAGASEGQLCSCSTSSPPLTVWSPWSGPWGRWRATTSSSGSSCRT